MKLTEDDKQWMERIAEGHAVGAKKGREDERIQQDKDVFCAGVKWALLRLGKGKKE